VALATGLAMASDGLSGGGGGVCAGSVSVGGTALRVFFCVLLMQDIFWLGFSKGVGGGQMKNLVPNVGIH